MRDDLRPAPERFPGSGPKDQLEPSFDPQFQMYQLATLGALTAGTAHELNNIAMVLDGVSGAVSDGMTARQPLDREDAEELTRAWNRLSALGIQLRALARQEPDRSEAHNLKDMLEDALKILRSIGRLKYVQVSTSYSTLYATITVPRRRFEHMLVNLLGNLVESHERGGARSRVLEAHVSLSPDEEQVQCRLRSVGGVLDEETAMLPIGTVLLEADVRKIRAAGSIAGSNALYALFDPQGIPTGQGLEVARRTLEPRGGRWCLERLDKGVEVRLELPHTH